MVSKDKCDEKKPHLDALLRFLTLTKEGTFSPVNIDPEKSPLIEEETIEEGDPEQEDYYYGIRN